MVAGKKGVAKAPRPRSGWVSEDDRHTVRLTLRLDPDAMKVLTEYAEYLSRTKAEIVEMALESFKNDAMTTQLMSAAKKTREEWGK